MVPFARQGFPDVRVSPTPGKSRNQNAELYLVSRQWAGQVGMAEFEMFREQAARLLALALKARERGDTKLADQLTEQAAQYLDKAGPLKPPPMPTPSSTHVSQQQQQPQPDDPDTTK